MKASPLTFDMLYDLTKLIKINEKVTVYDRWIDNDPSEDKNIPKYITLSLILNEKSISI